MPDFDHIDAFDTTVQKTNEWIVELCDCMGTEDRRRAYQILRAYLHALRDRLPIDELAQLGAQLPMLLRGAFYEGWDPSVTPMKMDAAQFLDRVAEGSGLVEPDEALFAARAATEVLSRQVSRGEVNQVIADLPQRLQRLLVR